MTVLLWACDSNNIATDAMTLWWNTTNTLSWLCDGIPPSHSPDFVMDYHHHTLLTLWWNTTITLSWLCDGIPPSHTLWWNTTITLSWLCDGIPPSHSPDFVMEYHHHILCDGIPPSHSPDFVMKYHHHTLLTLWCNTTITLSWLCDGIPPSHSPDFVMEYHHHILCDGIPPSHSPDFVMEYHHHTLLTLWWNTTITLSWLCDGIPPSHSPNCGQLGTHKYESCVARDNMKWNPWWSIKWNKCKNTISQHSVTLLYGFSRRERPISYACTLLAKLTFSLINTIIKLFLLHLMKKTYQRIWYWNKLWMLQMSVCCRPTSKN